jgi:hypothetical protein
MRIEKTDWTNVAAKKFLEYFDPLTFCNISKLPLAVVYYDDEKTIAGYFTYMQGKTFEGEDILEIRHLVGAFNPALIKDHLLSLAPVVRVVADRPGFNKICEENGFVKISTIWELK